MSHENPKHQVKIQPGFIVNLFLEGFLAGMGAERSGVSFERKF
jgi:hypothetical protein